MKQLKEPSLFWFDAHYCGGDSSQGTGDTPVKQEADVMLDEAPKGSVLLIDDARHFNGVEYPLLESFVGLISKRAGNPVTVFNDMIAARL